MLMAHAWRAGNSRHIQTLIGLASALLGCLEAGLPVRAPCGTQLGPPTPLMGARADAAAARVLTVNDFLFATGLDNINFFQLLRRACVLSCTWCDCSAFQHVCSSQLAARLRGACSGSILAVPAGELELPNLSL